MDDNDSKYAPDQLDRFYEAQPPPCAQPRQGAHEAPMSPWIRPHGLPVGFPDQNANMRQDYAVQAPNGIRAQLIPVSRRILSLCLSVSAKREAYSLFKVDVATFLGMYGLPAASLLATELLKQEQAIQPASDLLSRTELIPDLSVFIADLGNLPLGTSYSLICKKGQRILRRVLDRILISSAAVHMTAASHDPTALDAADQWTLNFSTENDLDFLQWLDMVDAE